MDTYTDFPGEACKFFVSGCLNHCETSQNEMLCFQHVSFPLCFGETL
jgi:hypothetical protein